jgi:hypothetical protein
MLSSIEGAKLVLMLDGRSLPVRPKPPDGAGDIGIDLRDGVVYLDREVMFGELADFLATYRGASASRPAAVPALVRVPIYPDRLL